jgi:hypothetical protein
MPQATEALERQSVKQLVFQCLVRQVVQVLQYQDPYHQFRWVGWTASSLVTGAWGDVVDFCCQGDKVDVLVQRGQQVALAVEFLFALFGGKQAGFDGTFLGHG